MTDIKYKKGLLLVISGFSGAGKGTLVKKIMEKYDNFALSVSMTTRNPRPGETNGKDYFFVTKEEFEDTINRGGFVEHACYCGNYYGTPKAYVEKMLGQGMDVILEIDVQGGTQVKGKNPESILLFVTPPSATELESRLRNRGTEDEETIRKRLVRAYDEVEYMPQYDFIAVNDNLDTCAEEIYNIVMAAKNAPERNREFIEEIRSELRGFTE